MTNLNVALKTDGEFRMYENEFRICTGIRKNRWIHERIENDKLKYWVKNGR